MTGWIRGQCVVAEDAIFPLCDGFANQTGAAVALDGDVAAVGVPYDSQAAPSYSGAVWIYRRQGTSWVCEQKLTSPNAQPVCYFGQSLSLSGDALLVGARAEDHPGLANAGAAYVFRYYPIFGWQYEARLTAPLPAVSDQFGSCVALDGDVTVVGAPLVDHAGLADAGAAYIYRKEGTTWVCKEELLPDSPSTGGRFGNSVSVSGSAVVVGCPYSGSYGEAFVYQHDSFSDRWLPEQQLSLATNSSGAQFGWSVAVQGDLIAVGS
jgi:hypothetical protein